jgi:hypothetical protein
MDHENATVHHHTPQEERGEHSGNWASLGGQKAWLAGNNCGRWAAHYAISSPFLAHTSVSRPTT